LGNVSMAVIASCHGESALGKHSQLDRSRFGYD
jgi:hypothetical protein